MKVHDFLRKRMYVWVSRKEIASLVKEYPMIDEFEIIEQKSTLKLEVPEGLEAAALLIGDSRVMLEDPTPIYDTQNYSQQVKQYEEIYKSYKTNLEKHKKEMIEYFNFAKGVKW